MNKILDDATLLVMQATLDRIGPVDNMPGQAIRMLIDSVKRLKEALAIARNLAVMPRITMADADMFVSDMARIRELVGE